MGLFSRWIPTAWWWLFEGSSDETPGDGADKLVLDRLRGREKLNAGRGRWPVLEASELIDGDRGRDRVNGDMGECGIDMPLLEDSLRGLENVEPAFELV